MNLIRWCSIARLFALVSAAAFGGCRSLPPQPPLDLSEPGWTIRQGQAVWKAKPATEGIAGDLLVALHWNGRSVVQFTKPPLPLVAAQRDTNYWQIQFFAQSKAYSGRGRPPERLLWLQLPEHLVSVVAATVDTDWSFSRERGSSWQFTNHLSGESLDGFLVTTRLPPRHRIQPDEQLLKVARRYGVTLEALRAVNPGAESAWFRIGAEMNLPPPPPPAPGLP
jgi:hypothetical protein